MADVSSCTAVVKINDKIQKGQQIGHFNFGGSTHCLVLPKISGIIKFIKAAL